MGVFTTKQFKKGMFLLQYSGDIISKKEGEKGKQYMEMRTGAICSSSFMMVKTYGKYRWKYECIK